MEKLDLKKEYKTLYKMKVDEIRRVEVPKQNIISIVGKGSPSDESFGKAIEKLFPIAYTIKFTQKELGKDFVVMPLEAYWWSENLEDFVNNNKENWQWEIFIVLPDYINKEDVERAKVEVERKKGLKGLDKVNFIVNEANIAYQILHIGPFKDEGPTVKKLHDYILAEGEELGGRHQEIYLSDFRRTSEDKLKTIIRQSIKER